MMEAFTEAARRRPEAALRHARIALAHAGAVGLSHDALRWAWPLAVRAAWELGDTQAVREQLALIDALQPGQLTPMLRAERDLARARPASENSQNGDELTAAITGIREHSTPYYLASALLDHAQLLARSGRAEAAAQAAAQAVDEAVAIAVQLRCRPLLDRAAEMKAEMKPAEADLTAAAGARPRTHATGTPT